MRSYVKQSARRALVRFRFVTAEARTLPDFVIIGGQKCGTSSLYAYLIQHPQILSAATKEVHFFDVQFQKGLRWYRSNFPLLLEMQCRRRLTSRVATTGEASPSYLLFPHVPRRLSGIIPTAKLIVLLRNPVDRAYSHYNHNIREEREPLSFKDAIASESERLHGELDRMLADESYISLDYLHFSYVQRGIYVDQLIAYEEFFDRGQILVLKSEDFFAKTHECYDQVLRFLRLDQYMPGGMRPRNIGAYSNEERAVNSNLRDYFEPHNQRLYKYLQTDFGW